MTIRQIGTAQHPAKASKGSKSQVSADRGLFGWRNDRIGLRLFLAFFQDDNHPASRMNRDDEYRAKAEEAQKQVDRATNELDRASWLRVVRGWLGLIRKRPQSDDTNAR